MADWGGKCIWFGEETLAPLKILQAHTLDICGQKFELAQAVVGMSMEAANQSLIVEAINLVSERATTKGDAEFTTDIISTTDVGSKSIEQGFDGCKRIFRTVRKKFSTVI